MPSFESDFDPFPRTMHHHPAVVEASRMMEKADIRNHEFFDLATGNRDLLQVWVGQELHVTNPFALLLLDLAHRISNVHLRSLVVSVATGEHGRVSDGIAGASHPWLLHQLALAVGVDIPNTVQLVGTQGFLRTLNDACSRSVVSAVGALGIGNEALLVPEYGRMLEVFDATWPEANARGFLNANISEDTYHADLMDQLATALLDGGAEEREYLAGARSAVEARLIYYDSLVSYFRR